MFVGLFLIGYCTCCFQCVFCLHAFQHVVLFSLFYVSLLKIIGIFVFWCRVCCFKLLYPSTYCVYVFCRSCCVFVCFCVCVLLALLFGVVTGKSHDCMCVGLP